MTDFPRLADRVFRGAQQYGAKFDPRELYACGPDILGAYQSGARVEIDVHGDGQIIERGRVSTTTGWRPAFLLMHRINAHGSSTLLDSRSRVIRTVAP